MPDLRVSHGTPCWQAVVVAPAAKTGQSGSCELLGPPHQRARLTASESALAVCARVSPSLPPPPPSPLSTPNKNNPQVINFPSDVHDQILKMASINLCPNVSGQICCTLMMTPPEPGQPSHDLYVQVCVGGGDDTCCGRGWEAAVETGLSRGMCLLGWGLGGGVDVRG